jgi:hypothetical protein
MYKGNQYGYPYSSTSPGNLWYPVPDYPLSTGKACGKFHRYQNPRVSPVLYLIQMTSRKERKKIHICLI